MPHGTDDPRQVLEILNSLGFVGITAEQLKSFMKDLKLHRKIKERQREQWQEETKRKIYLKQRQALTELIQNNSNDNYHQNVITDDSSIVKIKIKCVNESDRNDEIENNECNKVSCKKRLLNREKREVKKEIDLCIGDKKNDIIDDAKIVDNNINQLSNQLERVKIIPKRTTSAPELSNNISPSRSRSRLKSTTSDFIRRRNSSRSSSRSQSKSFIRPWKLHPQVQRPPQNVRSDPVLLYQQYQKEWKQRSLPGENRHAGIRWAVREKMLGTDPTPKPILKKSYSSMGTKRR